MTKKHQSKSTNYNMQSVLLKDDIFMCKLPLYIFLDDESYCVFCPPLDLIGYGEDEFEARKSFELNLEIFIDSGINENTIEEELISMGWRIEKEMRVIDPPSMNHILENNNDFIEMFKNYEYKKIFTQVVIPNFYE